MWQRVGRAVCSCYMVWRKKVIDSIYYNDLEGMSIFQRTFVISKSSKMH